MSGRRSNPMRPSFGCATKARFLRHLRFQVTLATPMATGFMYVSPVGRDKYLRAYERSLLKSLDHILGAIPAHDLSIQFDVCQEVLMFEDYFPVVEPNYKTKVFDQLARLANAIPTESSWVFISAMVRRAINR